MKRLAILSVLLFVAAVQAATLSLSLDRTRIYLGESVIANVTLEGSRDDRNIPVFQKASQNEIEYLGSRDNSQHSIVIINGKVTRNDFEGRVFVFRITPSAAGTFQTGTVSVKTPSGTISAPGARIEVTGVEKRDDISASVSCGDQTVLVESPFTITLSVLIRALPAPNADFEPIMPGQPLHLEAGYLNGEEVKGLKLPDLSAALNNLVSRHGGREAAFTLNDYKQRGMSLDLFDFGGDPFASRPIQFRIPPTIVQRGGTNYWEYAVGLDYTPTAEGDYTFGPITVKGAIIVGARTDGTARMDEVFVVGPAVTVRVVPPPEEGRPDYFVGSVGKSMRATASLDTSRCKVGDPLTLTLDLAGEISVSNLKPPLLSLQPGHSDDFRIYDDNIESENIGGGKRFKYRVRPLRAGTLEFPAILVAYFNTVKGAYETVATDPMPLQVEETTRIAASSVTDGPDADGGVRDASAGTLVPDGIVSAAIDSPPHCLARGPRALAAILAGAPALWLLVVALRAITGWLRRRRERGTLGRRASSNLRAFRQARSRAAKEPTAAAAAASSAARVALAAKLGLETVSLTVPEMHQALGERAVPDETIDEICSAFEDLERLSYSHGAEDSTEACQRIDRLGSALEKVFAALRAVIAAALLVGAATRETHAAGLVPDTFEWERAGQAMAAAVTDEDFLGAAAMYYAMVTNGAASGPLFYNLGTALLLAGKKPAAAEALIAAERRMGTSAEVADNLRIALADEGTSGHLPVSRVFLCWHYGIPFPTRIDLAVLGWTVFWLAVAGVAILGHGRRLRPLRTLLRAVAVLALILFAVYGVSAAITFLQNRHTDLPRTAATLIAPTSSPSHGKEAAQ
jgi:hypothetical protein